MTGYTAAAELTMSLWHKPVGLSKGTMRHMLQRILYPTHWQCKLRVGEGEGEGTRHERGESLLEVYMKSEAGANQRRRLRQLQPAEHTPAVVYEVGLLVT